MKKFVALGGLTAMVLASATQADTIIFELNREFSGATEPSGPSPWGTATFTDIGANTVSLTLTRAATLTANEFIRTWLFNLNPALNPAGLSITQSGGPTSTNTVRTGSDTDNAFRGDGGSYFDVKLEWPSTTSDANRFDGDWLSATYTLSMAGLDANDFVDLGVGAGNSPNGLYHAAHIQGMPNGASGWVTGGPVIIPLPAAAWAGMAGLGLVGVQSWRRRRATR
jgi:hypothetical protein